MTWSGDLRAQVLETFRDAQRLLAVASIRVEKSDTPTRRIVRRVA